MKAIRLLFSEKNRSSSITKYAVTTAQLETTKKPNKAKNKKKLFDPNGLLFFLVAVFMLCFVAFGSYYAYDVPGAIEEHFEHDLNVSTSTFTLFYSVYAWPNVVLCFFGGFVIDRWLGIDRGTIVFAAIILLGQVMFTLGTFLDTVWLMLLARFCFGMGAESFNSAVSAYYYLMYPKAKNINFILGLQTSLSRLGSTLTFVLNPLVYNAISGTTLVVNNNINNNNVTTLDKGGSLSTLGWTNVVATVVCSTTLASTFVLACLHHKRHKMMANGHKGSNETLQQLSGEPAAAAISVKEILRFPAQFWLLPVLGTAMYTAILPFTSVGKLFLMRTFAVDQDTASKANSLIYFISVFGTPLVGFLADALGFNAQWLVVSSALAVVAHVQFNFCAGMLSPYVPASILGVSYAITVAVLWPMVIQILEKQHLGTGFGIILTGLIIEYYGYFVLLNCYIVLGCVSILFSSLLWFIDYLKNGSLSVSSKQRELMKRSI